MTFGGQESAGLLARTLNAFPGEDPISTNSTVVRLY
jgi:hypothetical protein